MNPLFYDSVFTLTKSLSDIIEVSKCAVSSRFFYPIEPFRFFFLSFQVIDTAFIRENKHERKYLLSTFIGDSNIIFNVDSYQRLHHFVFGITLVLVAVKFFS